jgi:hydrogenase maturation protease
MNILIGGIGNIFFGDDAFGVEVVARLQKRGLPASARIRDFGIRGIDLVYALQECDVAILVDTVTRGSAPGTLYVIEADEPGAEPSTPLAAAHQIDPFNAVRLARSLGARPHVLVVGCEPESFGIEHGQDGRLGLSASAASAVDRAADMVEELCTELMTASAPSAITTSVPAN